ncbi:Asp23/Gls24 family envelope stress response protein [Erysipelothrix inopinata]|uniref:Asp23/Gls24 family envelope stress response protein n=1 Tax=Erysipelothrix inopinata TaxID=225084 RepID=A0A7G9RXL6_9FIRM|nr:Asp23/Gls24 family envelope stress response protein [Erysipelothrix inopinata]QNN60341.1 Asp23/Gls24 family envelope stress response protein [Erysipelothrix inopinata]
MANEYVLIQPQSEGLGQIAVSINVINHIAAITVNESKYVFFEDGTGKKSLSVTSENGHAKVDLKVRVQYGRDVERVCRGLQDELHRSIATMVDFDDVDINISVVGFKFN